MPVNDEEGRMLVIVSGGSNCDIDGVDC